MEITKQDEFFDKAFDEIIKQEGGYVNHPNDKGGETKYGITKREFPNLDIQNLTLEQAKDIYYNKYWIPSKCYIIPNYWLAEKVFSLSVNMGVQQACVLLQRALRAATSRELNEDGIIGAKTIGAIEVAMLDQVLVALKCEAAGFYRLLAQKDPLQKVFLRGWINRAYA